jgi:hypothetical protein
MTGILGDTLSLLGQIVLGAADASDVSQPAGAEAGITSSVVGGVNVIFASGAVAGSLTSSAAFVVDTPLVPAISSAGLTSSVDAGQFLGVGAGITSSVVTPIINTASLGVQPSVIASRVESDSGQLASARYLR